MAEPARADVRELWRQVERLGADAHELVRDLSAAQLAWRPAAGRWSVAENVAHLIAIGRWYFKQVDRSLDDAAARSLASDQPARLGPLERYVVWLAEPPVRRLRISAPPLFAPAAGQDPLAVPAAYRAHHDALRERLARAEIVDLHRARARTPLARRPQASLLGCLSLMLAHERRHLWQARQVTADPAFPNA